MSSLTFDPALDRYEMSGTGLDTQRFVYLDAIINTLAQHSIIVPALAQVEGEHGSRMLQELRLLKGVLSLHSLGIAQRKVAEALGVDLSNSKARTRRAGVNR